MSEEVLINVTPRETRVALLSNGILQEVHIERASSRGIVGNIYKGKVSRILPGMQAAFIDIGLDRAAFLHAADILCDKAEEKPDDGNRRGDDRRGQSANGKVQNDGERRHRDRRQNHPHIHELLIDGQDLLVQVIKDPMGTKGARLTTHISIPSRFLVFMPNMSTVGISQKIENKHERERLRSLVDSNLASNGSAEKAAEGDVAVAEEAKSSIPSQCCGGYIIRTAADGVSEESLQDDMELLRKLWHTIESSRDSVPAPACVHEDMTLALRTMRDLVDDTINRIQVDSGTTYQVMREFADDFIPELSSRIEHYQGDRPLFDLHSVEDELQKSLERRVDLKSGGHLVFDQTEAMTTIDINTGAYVGSRNLEDTIFKTNLEAAQAVARQLRLRNLGGIIIIDFIDMREPEHRRQVLRSLEKGLELDHTRSHISDVSPLGLVQMTRKRTRESLEHIMCETCPTCDGRGSIKTAETTCYEIFREILREARLYEAQEFMVLASQDVVDRFVGEDSASIAQLEVFIDKPVKFQVDPLYAQDQYDVVLM